MSFPVAGTLMIEPTESENLAEIDRFCDALIAIRAEIARVVSGEYDAHDNPLKNAPHTAEMLIAGEWKHPYDAEQAAYPARVDRRAKYWPPVRRIDQAYGDRNLVCACPATRGVRRLRLYFPARLRAPTHLPIPLHRRRLPSSFGRSFLAPPPRSSLLGPGGAAAPLARGRGDGRQGRGCRVWMATGWRRESRRVRPGAVAG